MKKRILGLDLRLVLLAVVLPLVITPLSVAHNQRALEEWLPTAELVGTWSGETEEGLAILLEINADGSVEGRVGEAVMDGNRIALNRNSFERKINIQTDYIIKGGTLNGKLPGDDSTRERAISLPFNLSEGGLRGSLFELEDWKYPYPLISRLRLEGAE